MMPHKRDYAAGIVYGLLSSATFGLIPLFTLPLLAAGIGAPSALACRFGIATLAMCAILLLKGEKTAIGMVATLKLLGLSSLYMLAVFFFFQAFNYLASGIVATIQFLYPLIVMLLMVCFFHETFHWKSAIACVLAIAGVALLSNSPAESGITQGGNTFLGVILALGAGSCNALYIVGLQVARLGTINGLVMTFYVMLFGSLFSLIQVFCTGGLQIPHSGREIFSAVMLALVTAVFSNLTLILSIQKIGSTLASILGVMEPLTAVAVGITVFGEPFNIQIACGIILVIIPVMIVLGGRKTP